MSARSEYMKDTFGGTIVSNEDFTSSFLEARDWLSSKGINVNNSRFMHCYKLLVEEEKVSWDTLWAHTELHDLVEIYENLGSLKSTRLIDSLKKSAKGPTLLRDEANSGGSIHGRNFTFELYAASRIAKAGFDVTFDTDSDINFLCEKMLIHTECKRVNSPDGLENLIDKAHKQIRKRCKDHGGRGLASLSISKLVNVAVTEDEFGQKREGMYANHIELQNLMRVCVAKWSQLIKQSFGTLEPMCVGVLLHYKMPFIDSSTNALSFLNRFGLIGYENSRLNIDIAKQISQAMSNSVLPIEQ